MSKRFTTHCTYGDTPDDKSAAGLSGTDHSRLRGLLAPNGRMVFKNSRRHRCPWCELLRNDKCFIHLSYHEGP